MTGHEVGMAGCQWRWSIYANDGGITFVAPNINLENPDEDAAKV